ncbi:hypothetical protein ABMA09_22655 [Erwinia rhapontici]|uniref:EAL domain-containing protein n=1 Tax=Erwinia rhapontici TaxID=55212 RepID=UPI003D361DB3
MIEMLKKAIQNNEFKMLFQPIFNFSSNSTASAESLIRWQNPVYGAISPSEFIPLAERSGLIFPITMIVINNVFAISKKSPGFIFTINLSGKDIANPDMLHVIDRLADQYNILPGSIIFEITETAIIDDLSSVLENFNGLRERGFRIHIDDFGTGFSSISYLKKFPSDAIKIDKTFTNKIHTNIKDQSIIKNMIGLGKAFDKKVIIEGVEVREQFDIVEELGADEVQGYFYSHPLEFQKLKILHINQFN